MKRALVILGTPHKKGNTARLVNSLLKQMPKEYEVQVVNPYLMKVRPCVDCAYCKTHSACAFHDLDDFYEAFEHADAVLFASPLYNLTVSAPMKALIDRFQRYFNARFVRGVQPPIARPRRAALVMTAGSANNGGFAFTTKLLKQSLTVLNGTLTAACFREECDERPSVEATEEEASSFLHAWLGETAPY